MFALNPLPPLQVNPAQLQLVPEIQSPRTPVGQGIPPQLALPAAPRKQRGHIGQWANHGWNDPFAPDSPTYHAAAQAPATPPHLGG